MFAVCSLILEFLVVKFRVKMYPFYTIFAVSGLD